MGGKFLTLFVFFSFFFQNEEVGKVGPYEEFFFTSFLFSFQTKENELEFVSSSYFPHFTSNVLQVR